MVLPLTLEEQKSQNWFKPTKKLGFYIGISDYSNVAREVNGRIYPVMSMPNVKIDVESFKNCMEKYQVTPVVQGKDRQGCLLNPKPKEIDEETNKLIRVLKEDKKMMPANNSLLVCLFAGLGVRREGCQALVQNEFIPSTGKIRMYMAEQKVRAWSEIYHNAYIMCIFACDREVYEIDGGLNSLHYVANTKSNKEIQDLNQAYKIRIAELKTQIAYLEKKESVYQEVQRKKEANKSDLVYVVVDYEKAKYEAIASKYKTRMQTKARLNTNQYGYCSNIMHMNWLMIFSCMPGYTSFPEDPLYESQVDKWLLHYKLIKGLIHEMETQYSPNNLVFDIPRQLADIESEAPEVEIIKSNSLQPLKLVYAHNIVQQSIAYIFVNTECNGLSYEEALEKGVQASKMFNEILHFKEVATFTDFSHEKIIDKLNHLQQRSQNFAEDVETKKRKYNDEGRRKNDEYLITEKFKRVAGGESNTISFKEARDITNYMQKERGEPNFHSEAFKRLYAKLDLDNDDKITLKEMITFDQNLQASFEDLVIAIYWIGFAVQPDNLLTCPELEQKFESHGFGQERAEREGILRQFELSYDGYPLCINEYATWIATESNTHVIQIDDFHDIKLSMEEFNSYIQEPSSFVFPSLWDETQDFKDYKAKGRSRHYFFDRCGTSRLYEALSERKDQGVVFCMPYEIKKTYEHLVDWETAQQSEEVIFDLRNEIQKADSRLNRAVTTYKPGCCDIWLDRPTIVQVTQVESLTWKASVHHIAKLNQILFIRPSNEQKHHIEFGFYNEYKYNLLQKILVHIDPESKYVLGSLVEEIEREYVITEDSEASVDLDRPVGATQGPMKIFVSLSSDVESDRVGDLLQFHYDKQLAQDGYWSFENYKTILSYEGSYEKIRVAYWILGWNIVVVSTERVLQLSDVNLEQEESEQQAMEFNENCWYFNIFTKTHASQNGFLTSLQICYEPSRDTYKAEYLSPFINFENAAFLLMKAHLNSNGLLEQKDTKNNSAFVWYEWPEAILEYAPDKLIVSVRPQNFLFFEDWLPIRHLKQSTINVDQYCIKPHPDFDLDAFPYVIASGKHYFTWINVKENLESPLIQAGRSLYPNFEAFIVLDKKFGKSVLFVEYVLEEQAHIWYEMQLKQDFHQILKETPILPNTDLKQKFKLMEHIKLNNNQSGTKTDFLDFAEEQAKKAYLQELYEPKTKAKELQTRIASSLLGKIASSIESSQQSGKEAQQMKQLRTEYDKVRPQLTRLGQPMARHKKGKSQGYQLESEKSASPKKQISFAKITGSKGYRR